MAGVQADLVALCKYLPLDGDGDHCTDWMDTVKKKPRGSCTVKRTLVEQFTVRLFVFAFRAPLMMVQSKVKNGVDFE